METATLKEQAMQRVVTSDPEAPVRVAGAFFLVQCDLATLVQQMPEMTDQELLVANEALGGFEWLNDPKEDVY